jgi:hypothetical protein
MLLNRIISLNKKYASLSPEEEKEEFPSLIEAGEMVKVMRRGEDFANFFHTVEVKNKKKFVKSEKSKF